MRFKKESAVDTFLFGVALGAGFAVGATLVSSALGSRLAGPGDPDAIEGVMRAFGYQNLSAPSHHGNGDEWKVVAAVPVTPNHCEKKGNG